jgi:uncharacterized protein YecE (DUF72 family)
MSQTISTSSRRNDGQVDQTSLGTARVGCSGWHYKHWKGVVYPTELATAAWLDTYTQWFSTVELNNSFYRLPSAETFASWRRQVPRGFLFAVKASRFLTHIKRLRDPDEPLTRLFTNARPLGPTLGPVLYQIPPRWFPDAERLEIFLRALPERLTPRSKQRLHHVLEMRDPRGYEPWVIDLLRAYNVTLCVHDMPGSESPLLTVGPIIYVRFHGFGAKYGGSYPDEVLDEWAQWLRRGLASGRDAYVYFNNDINGYSVNDAERLRVLIDGTPSSILPPDEPARHQNAGAYRAYPIAGRGSRVATACAGDTNDESL